jgi:ATP-dependent Clp protease ATP-binding subunit ClpA
VEEDVDTEEKLKRIGLAAVRRKFSPEFVNRLDVVLTYRPLTMSALTAILDMQLSDLQQHIIRRLGARAFRIVLTKGARQWLLRKGTSIEYGARELKRTILRNITQPLAAALAAGRIEAGSRVSIEVERDGEGLRIVAARDGSDADLFGEDAA